MRGFYGLSVRACVSTPTICSPPRHGQRHADTLTESAAMCLILAHHKLRHKAADESDCIEFMFVSVEACVLTSVSQEMSPHGRQLCPSGTLINQFNGRVGCCCVRPCI